MGISSVANFLGALSLQYMIGKDAKVVTIFSDDNKKYLSTDLMRPEPVKDGFMAPEVSLVGVDVIKRTCETCEM